MMWIDLSTKARSNGDAAYMECIAVLQMYLEKWLEKRKVQHRSVDETIVSEYCCQARATCVVGPC